MRLLVGLMLLAGCSFSGSQGTIDDPDGSGSGSGSGTGTGSGSGSGSGSAARGRRIVLTIPAAKVTEVLTDFPVYVDITDNELKTALTPTQISFKQRSSTTVVNLAYEVQSFDKNAGRLRAWVLLPKLDVGENVFELQYGDASVAVLPNPAEVWRNHFKAVFHLESSANPIADSHGTYPGTPSELQVNASIDAKMGKGVDFDGNINGVVTFANPITGAGPSTISLWVNHDNGINKDALVVLGTGSDSQGRWLHAQFNNNQVGLGLVNDDWLSTGVDLEDQGWKLLHWTYDNKVSRLYQNAALVGNPFTHANAANTQGTGASLGNARGAGFDNNAGLDGTIDEVRISDVARSAGWIAAEFANQTAPTTFVTHVAPSALP